jgi:hypothetical protein
MEDKCTEILKNERDAIIQSLIETLNELKSDFYSGHIHIDKEHMIQKIDDLWENYSFEMKYRALKSVEGRCSDKKNDKI